jgi:hypothetical protein
MPPPLELYSSGAEILFYFEFQQGILRGGICPYWIDSSGAYVLYAPRLDTPLMTDGIRFNR